jgi:hypothetical protein
MRRRTKPEEPLIVFAPYAIDSMSKLVVSPRLKGWI